MNLLVNKKPTVPPTKANIPVTKRVYNKYNTFDTVPYILDYHQYPTAYNKK